MRTLPSTPTPSQPQSRTPTPSPDRQQPQPEPEQPTHIDPLVNAQVSRQLQSIREQLDPTQQAEQASPTSAESMLAKVALERGGDTSASQEEILANASFLGGDNALPAASSDEEEGEEEEVFATPPDARQHQGDPVTMCTLPFTPTPSKSKSKSPTHDADDNAPPTKKPSVCITDARMSTPTPSSSQQQHQQPEPEQPAHADPLVRAVLTIPAKTTTTSSSCPVQVQDFLALGRHKGII
uniref:Uncharacterized protein n=1 Tax=Avena sativa TaxID=4498 RepID=A0ACD5XYE7_AVESA